MSDSIKSDILGNVGKPNSVGGFVIDLNVVQQPFVEERSVIRACCLGCGYCLEITEEGADKLIELVKVERPNSWQGYYFTVQRCMICQDAFEGVVLEKITS